MVEYTNIQQKYIKDDGMKRKNKKINFLSKEKGLVVNQWSKTSISLEMLVAEARATFSGR